MLLVRPKRHKCVTIYTGFLWIIYSRILTMKILMASDCYIYQTGGVTNVVLSLVRGLRKNGHDVRVLALSNSSESYKDDYNYFIGSVPAFYYPEQRLSLIRNNTLLGELIAWNPDIIHLHTEGSILHMARMIAKATNTPTVMTAHTDYAHFIFGEFRETLPVKLLANGFGKFAYDWSSAIIAPSEKARDFPALQPVRDRVHVIPNGIEIQRYQKEVSKERKKELIEKCGFIDNGQIMVVISRVSKEKNIRELIRYMPQLLKKVPGAQLLVVGDGPDRSRLEAQCSTGELATHVRFIGRVDPDEVYNYYAIGDIFLSASTFEVHSMSYLEALSCGLPIVCREDRSIEGVILHGENGFIYRTENEFIDYVSRLLNDPELRVKTSKNAVQRAERFTDDICVQRTFALYKEVLDQHAS